MKDINHFFNFRPEDALFIDPVFGQISPQICSGCDLWFRLAGLQYVQDGTGFGITDTEKEEMEGIFLREDDKIGLNATSGNACGGLGPFSVPYEAPQISGG
jgi:hypothetical protein